MDAEVKKAWVEALRSGEYKQGQKSLRSLDDKFCCLGVLCAISGVEWKPGDPEWTENAYEVVAHHDDTWLPAKLRNAVSINDEEQTLLANMNDEGKSFAEIADYIEANL